MSQAIYSYSVQTYTHTKTHIHLAVVILSLSLSPLSLWFTSVFFVYFWFFAGKNIQKVLKIMHINFLVLILLVFFGRFASMWALFLFFILSTWNFLCKPLSGLCAGSSSPAAFLTGDAVKSVATINRWIWIIPCEPDSRKTHIFGAHLLVFAVCLGAAVLHQREDAFQYSHDPPQPNK